MWSIRTLRRTNKCLRFYQISSSYWAESDLLTNKMLWSKIKLLIIYLHRKWNRRVSLYKVSVHTLHFIVFENFSFHFIGNNNACLIGVVDLFIRMKKGVTVNCYGLRILSEGAVYYEVWNEESKIKLIFLCDI